MTDITQRPLEITQAELDRATERIDELQQKLSLYENLTAEYGLSIFADISEAVAAECEACAKAFEAEVETWEEMRKAGFLGAIKRKGAAAIRARSDKGCEK